LLRILPAVAVVTAFAGGCAGRSSSHPSADPPARPMTTFTTTTVVAKASTASGVRTPRRARPARRLTYAGAVTAIGDSVMLDAAPVLRARLPAIDVDASTDRAVETGITELALKADNGENRGAIVFHLGNNSSFGPGQILHVLEIAAGRRVVLVTDHCAHCSWVPANNMVIHAYCRRADRCFVADWEALADAHPAWFGSDGVHMPIGGAGARAYTELVVDALDAP
jgi:hypothetical protein